MAGNLTSKNVYSYEIYYKKNTNVLVRVVKYLVLQARISLTLYRLSKCVDVFIFFTEGVGILPMLTVRLLRKKIVWVIPSSIVMKRMELHKKPFYKILIQTQTICAILSTKIILYSHNLIREWYLEKFRKKIEIAHEHFLNFLCPYLQGTLQSGSAFCLRRHDQRSARFRRRQQGGKGQASRTGTPGAIRRS